MQTFTDRLAEKIVEKRSIVCGGFDPQMKFMPPHLIEWARFNYGDPWEAAGRLYARFNIETIDVIESYVVAVKPQSAFYEAYGHWGIWALEETIKHAATRGLIVILDGKRGDGGDSAQAYADTYLGKVPCCGEVIYHHDSPLAVDALTVQPWIGSACLEYFLRAIKEFGKGVFVVDKTSFNPNSEIEQLPLTTGLSVWQEVAHLIHAMGEGTEGQCGYRNFGAVVGATYPEEARIAREIMPRTWFLIPGYGAQGGGADGAVVGIDGDGFGGLVNSARGIIAAWQRGQFKTEPERFAEASARAAEFSRDELNAALSRAGKLN